MNNDIARTSLTHPLIINTVKVGNGELGLTFCPGKKQAAAMTGAWDRDMELDLAAIERWGATSVISLLEPFEYEELQVPDLPEAFTQRFHWLNLPIPDKHAPDNRWTAHWATIRADIQTALAQGEKILIHCKGGFGRTGTVAAMILIDHGYHWQKAIEMCRNVRNFAVETRVQEQYLEDYQSFVGSV